MTAWKILVTDGLEENGLSILRETTEVTDRAGVSAEELLDIVGEYDALIVRGRTKVNAAVFDAACKLKVVGRAGVGVDNIDLDAARRRGIIVVNSPTATTIAVAELTMSMMLSLARELPRADASMKEGKWLKKTFEGAELYQKTLGIVGLGRIGMAVAKRASAFGMKVIFYDPFISIEEIHECGCDPVSLDELAKRSDIITLHIPLTDRSRDLFDARRFAMMKDGVRLIDAARGGIVNEAALLEALKAGKVAGAALDVFSSEPPTPELIELINHPQVIATPHIGAQTAEAQKRAAHDISTEVLAALRGEPLRWQAA